MRLVALIIFLMVVPKTKNANKSDTAMFSVSSHVPQEQTNTINECKRLQTVLLSYRTLAFADERQEQFNQKCRLLK